LTLLTLINVSWCEPELEILKLVNTGFRIRIPQFLIGQKMPPK